MSNAKEDEYRERLSAARRDYDNAVAERAAYRRQKDACIEARQIAAGNVIAGGMKKINFERRIRDIERIIRMIEEMNNSISDVVKKAGETDEAYAKCIHCDVKSSVSFSETFPVKSVEQDAYIAEAKAKLQAEKQRLQEELENLKREIAANEQRMADLQRQINICTERSIACTAKIVAKDIQMDFYRVQLSRM